MKRGLYVGGIGLSIVAAAGWLTVAVAFEMGARVFSWEVWIWAVCSTANLASLRGLYMANRRLTRSWDQHRRVFHGKPNRGGDL